MMATPASSSSSAQSPTVSNLPSRTSAAEAEPVEASAQAGNETGGGAAEKGSRKGPARKVGLFVLVALVAALGWHVASDLIAPSSSIGSVAAFTTQIAPRVSGQVSTVHVIDNQEVKAGEPLFSLDLAPFELAVRQAQVGYDQALLASDASLVSLASVEAQLAQAQAGLQNQQASTDRSRELFERGVIPQSQLDAALTQLSSAQSTLDAARAQLDSARLQAGGETNATPQVQAAALQLEQARLNQEFTTILAPSDGVITNLKLAAGQFVNAGTPALTFIDRELPWVVVDLRENQLVNVGVGDQARVVFDGAPGQTFDARVRGIAWGIDPGRTAANGLPQNQAMTRWFEPARTIPVQLELTDLDQWPANVRVGSKASALIYAQGPSTPVAAVSTVLQTIGSYLSYLY